MCVRSTKGDVFLVIIQIFMQDTLFAVGINSRDRRHSSRGRFEASIATRIEKSSLKIFSSHCSLKTSFHAACLSPINLINHFLGWKGNLQPLRSEVIEYFPSHSPMGDLSRVSFFSFNPFLVSPERYTKGSSHLFQVLKFQDMNNIAMG